jgi:hypothetical protein
MTKLSGYEAAQVIADLIGVPGRGAQQPLHRLRIGVPGLLRQPPAVLPL